jgi:two-component system chemotaxis sensor kinase CheA
VLEVPITVAVVEAFRCQSAQQSFLIPVASVEEFVDVDPADLVAAPVVGELTAARAALLSRRGRAMPFVELSALLGGQSPVAQSPVAQSPAAQLPDDPPLAGKAAFSKKAIIVRRNEQYFAFGVDRLLDHQEVIIRRLADPLVDVVGVSGSADLGDGHPTLLLDLIALSRMHGGAERAA